MTAGWPAMSIAQAHALLTAPGSPFEMEELVIRGVKTRVWKHAPPSIRAVLEMSRAHGEKIFLVHEDERVSFEALYRAVCALAWDLRSQGVEQGDRVAIVMRNLPEWPVAFYAAASLGAIVTPLNAWWTGPELEYGLVDSGSKVAIVDAERLERLTEHLHNCPDLKRVYVSRSNEEIANPLICKTESVIGAPAVWAGLPDAPLPAVDIGPEDDATIFYTSGTPGKPKGALATHRGVNSNIMAGAIGGAGPLPRPGGGPPPPPPPRAPPSGPVSVPVFPPPRRPPPPHPPPPRGAKNGVVGGGGPARPLAPTERG